MCVALPLSVWLQRKDTLGECLLKKRSGAGLAREFLLIDTVKLGRAEGEIIIIIIIVIKKNIRTGEGRYSNPEKRKG